MLLAEWAEIEAEFSHLDKKMTQPITPQQIAEIKAVVEENHKTDFYISNGGVAGIIATLEARNAAFDEMLAALRNLCLVQEGVPMTGIQATAYLTAARSAIAHAEKVK